MPEMSPADPSPPPPPHHPRLSSPGQALVSEARVPGLGEIRILAQGRSFLSSHPLLPEPQAGFEGLQAEECGILNGCENGRCVRVREGYTCDCFEGFQLDAAHMACVGKLRGMELSSWPTAHRDDSTEDG